jgi:hypothetical protein
MKVGNIAFETSGDGYTVNDHGDEVDARGRIVARDVKHLKAILQRRNIVARGIDIEVDQTQPDGVIVKGWAH